MANDVQPSSSSLVVLSDLSSLSLIRKPSSTSINLKFGITEEELDLIFNNVGFIITSLLESKLSAEFYEVLDQLKPIRNIDQYMVNFNFDKDVALRHNSDLASIVCTWGKEAHCFKSRSESELESFAITDEFIRLIENQERDYSVLINRAIHKLKSKTMTNAKSETAVTDHQSKEKDKKDESTTLDGQVMLTMRCDGKSGKYSLTEALNVAKQTKERHQNQLYASECYKKCVDVLAAINENNKKLISKWTVTDEALLNRNAAWHTKLEAKQISHNSDGESLAHSESAAKDKVVNSDRSIDHHLNSDQSKS